ncbi:uncharacterized protein SAPINGB_P002537 [Magnusiomyces paraingens]|uniref:Glycosyl transferase family 25 domain-containing protein n=1 Tax=Magnusiomyces paraingens TaxID=2606893 RepID=A0A5E8BEF4_9ASCO|nr:uncharacterized protein SAPINGB_P002537 [Saprochaete ingens]VVT49973.1 unnamed protein product [Saprochaete ingens]
MFSFKNLRLLVPAVAIVVLILHLSYKIIPHNPIANKAISTSFIENNDDSSLEEEPYKDDLLELTNSTLGFSKLIYLNVPSRYDLDDTMTMQSVISGIRPERFEGVTTDDVTKLNPNNDGSRVIDPKGFAPAANRYLTMGPGGLACFRSHANIWRLMIKNNWKTLLVLEGDAAWDVNIRRIMPHFSRGLEQLMHKLGKIDNDTHVSRNDPYLSDHWDFINLGGCYANPKRKELSVQYYDPYAPEGTEKSPLMIHGMTIEKQRRLVRYQTEEACTGAYAITRQGAHKLLLRSMVDMGNPVDLVIRGLVASGALEDYSVFPILFNQGSYRKDLGPQSKGSETGDPNKNKQLSEANIPWDDIHKTMNIWRYGIPGLSRFKKGMLLNLQDYIFTKTEPMLDTDLGGKE